MSDEFWLSNLDKIEWIYYLQNDHFSMTVFAYMPPYLLRDVKFWNMITPTLQIPIEFYEKHGKIRHYLKYFRHRTRINDRKVPDEIIEKYQAWNTYSSICMPHTSLAFAQKHRDKLTWLIIYNYPIYLHYMLRFLNKWMLRI